MRALILLRMWPLIWQQIWALMWLPMWALIWLQMWALIWLRMWALIWLRMWPLIEPNGPPQRSHTGPTNQKTQIQVVTRFPGADKISRGWISCSEFLLKSLTVTLMRLRIKSSWKMIRYDLIFFRSHVGVYVLLHCTKKKQIAAFCNNHGCLAQ